MREVRNKIRDPGCKMRDGQVLNLESRITHRLSSHLISRIFYRASRISYPVSRIGHLVSHTPLQILFFQLLLLLLVIFALPVSAEAHLNSTGMGPIYDGLMHFLISPEDLVPAHADFRDFPFASGR